MPSQVLRRSKRRKLGDDDTYKTWRNADMDVLWEIFLLLPEEELFFKISKVCQWWQYVCWEILFWINYHTINFSKLHVVLNQGYHLRRKMSKSKHCIYFKERVICLLYENILLHGLNWILGSVTSVAYRDRLNYVTEVVLPYDIDITDGNLVYMRKIRDLRQLRGLTITRTGVQKEGVETIMANCEKLSRLNLVNCALLDSGMYLLLAISVEVKRNHTKWYIDGQEELSSIQELIEQLWTL